MTSFYFHGIWKLFDSETIVTSSLKFGLHHSVYKSLSIGWVLLKPIELFCGTWLYRMGSFIHPLTDCFSKVPWTFRVRKAKCQISMHWFWKADLLAYFYCKKNKEDYEVWWLRTSVLRGFEGNCGTRNGPKSSGLLINRGPFLESPENFSGPKSYLSNCNPLVLKRLSFYMFLI